MATGDDAPTDTGELDVGAAVAVLYAGPPDDFVAGRDALVRTLRAAKRRDEATEVKSLRKPKAVARALNAARLHDPGAVDDLAAAVAAVAAAQDGDGDVRTALGALRDAERAVSEAALAATAGADRAVDAATVGGAVRAVLADPDALGALRAGRLVDLPAGGGFGVAGLGAAFAPEQGAHDEPRAEETSRERAAGRAAGTKAASAAPAVAPAAHEPRPVAVARRAVAAAEDARRLAADAVDEVAPDVETAEAAERAARQEADQAARRAEEAREQALAAARIATAARREAAARARRRDQADAALAKARARLAKLEEG